MILSPALRLALWTLTLASVAGPRVAAADDLGALLADAREGSLELAESDAMVEEAEAEVRVEQAALLPTLSVSAGYTLNQHDSLVTLPAMGGAVDEITIVPHQQVDATVTLSVPVLDVAAWRRIDAARAAAVARRAATAVQADGVDRAVVLAWYQWVAGTALIEAAKLAEATARDTVTVVEGRVIAGSASDADVARARADVATAAQDVAIAELAVAEARRELRTLTGREPEGAAPALAPSLDAEAPLDSWLDGLATLPAVRAAAAERSASQARADAVAAEWLPTIAVFARERLSNAAGFGEVATFSIGVTATWNLDLATGRRAARERAAVRTGAVRVTRAVQDANDRIVDAWNTADARRATATAAIARVEAARSALELTRTRVTAGLAVPVDLTVAQRDAFAAEVSLLQAHAELAAARALLRLAAGRGVDA